MNENDRQAALDALPHGPEFRFIDEILELDPGRSGRAIYRLPATAGFLRGHFPGAPLMPGVLMIEGMAQLAGVVAQCDPAHERLANLRLTAVRGAKIRGSFGPGEGVEISAEIVGRLGNLVQARASVLAGGESLAEAQLTLSGDRRP